MAKNKNKDKKWKEVKLGYTWKPENARAMVGNLDVILCVMGGY